MEAKRLCCCCCDDLMAAFSTKPIQANAWVLFCRGKEDTYHELCVHNMHGGVSVPPLVFCSIHSLKRNDPNKGTVLTRYICKSIPCLVNWNCVIMMGEKKMGLDCLLRNTFPFA
jgi:hypothetical protein